MEEQLNMMRRGRQFKQLMNKKMDGIIREYDVKRVEIEIQNETRTLYKNILTYAKSFADVYVGEPLVYVNSLDCMAVAINQGSFARAYNIGTGTNWRLTIRKAPRLVYE